MNSRKKKGQTIVEYVILTAMVMTVGLALSKYSSTDYRDSVYNFWSDIIARPLPAP